MRRREFLFQFGAAAVLPVTAWAQQLAQPVIGFLSGTSKDAIADGMAGFRKGLGEGGYAEAKNLMIEFRWSQGDYGKLPALAIELVKREVSVIAAFGPPAALAAKAATAKIPIVFTSGADVVKSGLVASLNQPGGNVTGVNLFTQAATPKRLDLLDKLVPADATFALLLNPNNPATEDTASAVQKTAGALGRRLMILKASSAQEIDAAFAAIAQQKAGGLIVNADPFFDERQRGQLVALAAKQAIPTIYGQRGYVADGGLISYGTSIADAYRQVGGYVARILKGEKPADLPVLQPTNFELVVNIRTAKAQGIAIPPGVMAIADEVIE